jgi:O-methyltransferase
MVVCGVSPATADLLRRLRVAGLGSAICAVVTSQEPPRSEFCGIPVIRADEIGGFDPDALIIVADAEKEDALRSFAQGSHSRPRVIFAGDGQYTFQDPAFSSILESCSVKPKAWGYPLMLVHLFQALRYLAKRKISGDVAEFGVLHGGTTVFLAKAMEHLGVSGRIYGFDTFRGFPPPASPLDLFFEQKYSLANFENVRRYCEPYPIDLIRGDIAETYQRLHGVPLALCFFDTDNYTPVRAALPTCAEQLVPGGVLAFDHYYSPGWGRTIGEKMAADEVISSGEFFHLHGTGIFLKC